MKVILLVFLTTFLTFSLLSAKEPTLEQVKKEYAATDTELNKVYQRALKEMKADEAELFRKKQREWIEYRDYIAEWQVEEGTKKEDSVYYWELMKGLTEEQVDLLKTWPGVTSDDGWTVYYTDGRGGWLSLQLEEDKVRFQMSVTRGPTFHVGEIAGVAEILQSRAVFMIQEEGVTEKTILTFDNSKPNKLEVVGKNTSPFHGARAYFDGLYQCLSKEPQFEDWNE